MAKEKPLYKKGDKVCVMCAKIIDKKNQKLPWFSEQLRAKDKYIEELLSQIEVYKSEKSQALTSTPT